MMAIWKLKAFFVALGHRICVFLPLLFVKLGYTILLHFATIGFNIF